MHSLVYFINTRDALAALSIILSMNGAEKGGLVSPAPPESHIVSRLENRLQMGEAWLFSVLGHQHHTPGKMEPEDGTNTSPLQSVS